MTKYITSSYTVGASYINTLNQDTNYVQYRNFPKIAFYAIEPQENLFWRTLKWMATEPNDSSVFGANDDWHLLDKTVLPIIDDFQGIREAYYNEYIACRDGFWISLSIPFIGWINMIIEKVKAEQAYEKYLACNGALEWFNNANESWKTIIGARVQNGNTVTYKTENDGIVLAESAYNLPRSIMSIRVCGNEFDPNAKSKGSSHMQVRNDEGLKRHLKRLFNGDYGWWFYVEEKP